MSNNSVNSHGGNNDNNNGSNQLPANAPLGQQQLQQQPLLQQQLQALPAGQALMAQLLQEALNRNERLAQQQQQERQEQQRQLFQLVETIQQLNAALNQKTTELAQRTTELAQKTAESAVLNERLQAEIAQKTAESTALNQKTAELAQKTTELAQKTAESAALQAETQRLENEINATKCTFKEYLDRHIPYGVCHNLSGYTRPLQSGSAAGSAAGSGANTPQSASGLSDGLEILSPSDPPMECMPTEQPPPPPPQSSSSSSSSSSSKRPRTDELVFDKSNITSFSIRQGDDTDGPTLVPANFKFHGNMANVNAEKIHLSLWADFDDCVLGNIAKLIMMNGNRDVSWESADRIEKRMALTTVYNEAFLATSYQQIIQDLIHTIKADELALKVVPEFGVSGNRVDLMVLCREHYHVTIEMKVPNSIGSVLGPKPENILKLSVQQHKTYVKNITARGGKDAKIKRATTSQAAGCLYQLITYMATAKVAYGILSTYEHSWFVKRGPNVNGEYSFLVSESVLCQTTGPCSLRNSLYFVMCSFQLEAAGYGSPPPALQAALGPASASFVRDGRGLYRHSAIEIHKTDTRRCSCGGGKVMTSLDSGVSLVLGKESVKTVLNLHNAIAQGRTGAGFVGCLDGQRVAIKGVSFTFYDNTNYQAIRKETLFYDKHKDLQGDAIPLVVEAVVSRDCAFLVMELGQSCQSWSDADRSLAAHALSKLHARHILHGDLHSGNVVFVGQGDERKARIIDLESAREYRGQDFGELAAREMARVVRFGTATEYDRKHGE